MKAKAIMLIALAGLAMGSLAQGATYQSVLRVNMTAEADAKTAYSGAGILDTTTGVQWHNINGLWDTNTNHNVSFGDYTITMSNRGGAAQIGPTLDLFDGYARWTTSGTATMTISGLNAAMTYDLTVFSAFGWWNIGQDYYVTDGNGDTSTLSTTGLTRNSFVPGDNYQLFQGLVPDGTGKIVLNIPAAYSYDANGVRGAAANERILSGFELGAIPEPSTFALAALGGLALLRRRR